MVPITRALISVSDKTGIVELATFLVQECHVELLSTGGTAKVLREAGLTVKDVSEYTGATECLDGRVKTLHPKVHGGLLAVRGNAVHAAEMKEQGMDHIDLTVINLYPFEATVQSGATYSQCIENIDIGGPSMLRSTAKNHAYTTIVTDPSQYAVLQQTMRTHAGGTTLALRQQLAATAFAVSAAYDSTIATWFAQTLTKEKNATTTSSSSPPGTVPPAPVVTKVYQPEFPLKYGCNPHQNPAQILSRFGHPLPFAVLNGTPGYINLLDAANAWQLVSELKQATGLAAAASFKHVSPAGGTYIRPMECHCTPLMLW